MTIQLINRIFKPCLASDACIMLGRGSPIAVPGDAAGGTYNHKRGPASGMTYQR